MRYGLRRLFGRDAAAALVYIPTIVTLTFSGSLLGLTLTGVEAWRLLTEVVPRRAAWKRYVERLANTSPADPGAVIRLESGERFPRQATVLEGTGTALERSAAPVPIRPGARVSAGSRLFGGPVAARLEAGEGFVPSERPAPVTQTLFERYSRALGPVSLSYAAITAILTRSYLRTFAALLLVSPRPALIGAEAAELGASARVLRAGVTVVGMRTGRGVRLPDTLILDGPRVLTDGFEVSGVFPSEEQADAASLLARASSVASAAGMPWGRAFRLAVRASERVDASDGSFDGTTARATINGERYSLTQITDSHSLSASLRMRHKGEHLLVLESEHRPEPLGIIALRPRLAPGAQKLVETCRLSGVELVLLPGDESASAQALAQRARVALLPSDDAITAIRERQAAGDVVAYVSDGAHAAAAFQACDLAIGLSDGTSQMPARADLLAPDLDAVSAILDAGARRKAATRDSVALSAISNVVGAALGLPGEIALLGASRSVYVAALAALGDQWLRLRGGQVPHATQVRIVDPRPERWGERSVESVLQTLNTSPDGLSTAQANERQRGVVPAFRRRPLAQLVLDQLRSPLTVILGAGAAFSLVLGAPADVAIIGATIAGNVLIGAWQERRADAVAETLNTLGTATATVLRNGHEVQLLSTDLVPGDMLLLSSGDHIPADARVVEADSLEVDEAALTGESLPVAKSPDGPTPASRIVQDGSSVTTGTGRAVVVAVGQGTRMGATAAALSTEEATTSPLDERLAKALRQIIPVAVAGGALVAGANFFRTRSLLSELATGSVVAIAAVPEGLPILTRVSEAGVARRLASRNAIMRRLSAVEALGRVDVACTDKTGTLTQGHLALGLVADPVRSETAFPGPLSPELDAVLLAAAFASPAPDASGASAHATDVAVTQGALEAGLEERLRVPRDDELPFDAMRAFHASRIGCQVYLKGAPESVAPRCATIRIDGGDVPLDGEGYDRLLTRAKELAGRGLRVLLVAEGSSDTDLNEPADLVALGFVGISDPLRPGVRAAVKRCHDAGIRVVMLTGDHPATARAIAQQAGLLNGTGDIITADELAELQNGELDERLERVTVIARATPIDKLRIIESLQRSGHTVAMTGDGVNDAPALRLADVGIAMGRGGTEVARQTADVVLADDDFSTLVEALVEGRSFWSNIRRAVGLLLGGNLGELGIIVGASTFGLAAPLTARQILVVNMITDILPGLAVALQQPEHRNLAGLAREGTTALDRPLRADVIRRGSLTALPSLAAYVLALATSSAPQAQTVVLSSLVTTQLAQTLDVGWTEGHLSVPVAGAVGGAAGLLGAAFAIPSLRALFGLTVPGPLGWALIGGSTLTTMVLSRVFSARTLAAPMAASPPRALPAPEPRLSLPDPSNV